MGQKIYTDKLGALSFSTPNILMGPATLTIGGQQYVTTTTLSVALPALTAVTLYMVYAVLSAGVPALAISTNVNSVGPSSFSSWKLVGAFYSNGLTSVDFGAFVSIEGAPTSEWFSTTNSMLPSVGAFGSPSAQYSHAMRDGDSFRFRGNFTAGTTAGADAILTLPTTTPISATKMTVAVNKQFLGEAKPIVAAGTNTYSPQAIFYDGSTTTLVYITDSIASQTYTKRTGTQVLATGNAMTYDFSVPIQNLSIRPLRDL